MENMENMENKVLRKILKASEKASKEYEKTEERLKIRNDKVLMMTSLLHITFKVLCEIEAMVKKGLKKLRDKSELENKALRRILKVLAKESKQYKKTKECSKIRKNEALMIATLLQITCRGLEKIENIVKEKLEKGKK